MITRIDGASAARDRLTRRGEYAETALPAHFAARIAEVFGEPLDRHQVVSRILADVRASGDAAVRRYTVAFDGTAPEAFEVPQASGSAPGRESIPSFRTP